MRRVLYIGLLLLLAVACGPRIISRSKMQKIMADVLVQSEQIRQDLVLSRRADTMLVYEGIFEAYGYDTDDFLRSLGYYLSDPSRMEKIMGNVAEDLEARAKVVKARIDVEGWQRGYLRIYELPVEDTTVKVNPPLRPSDTLYIRFLRDSVCLHLADTLR